MGVDGGEGWFTYMMEPSEHLDEKHATTGVSRELKKLAK
jgi:hypothetical protein